MIGIACLHGSPGQPRCTPWYPACRFRHRKLRNKAAAQIQRGKIRSIAESPGLEYGSCKVGSHLGVTAPSGVLNLPTKRNTSSLSAGRRFVKPVTDEPAQRPTWMHDDQDSHTIARRRHDCLHERALSTAWRCKPVPFDSDEHDRSRGRLSKRTAHARSLRGGETVGQPDRRHRC